ncbi:MAG: hypothetical protein Kow0010_16560 [Dehalococcoidia bacterium]
MENTEHRIALLLDFENLAIGARDAGIPFDIKAIADALAERGRVVVRRAYADWSQFSDDRRKLVQANVDLIEIPQRMGGTRKNAADIKLAVDAMELAFEREYITTFVIGTGDSDFTPLVRKLRELNRRVIGIGLRASTSALLPPACDEFLFYETLEGTPAPTPKPKARPWRRVTSVTRQEEEAETEEAPVELDESQLASLVTQTLAGLKRTEDGVVLASMLKRAILRKNPTFNEADYGYRAFGELLADLARQGVIELSEGPARGDPEVDFPGEGSEEEHAFELLASVVRDLEKRGEKVVLTGLKNEIRKRQPGFSEKEFGFRAFLQFCKAARTRGYIDMTYDDQLEDYVVRAAKE